jgi:hypothetical protein
MLSLLLFPISLVYLINKWSVYRALSLRKRSALEELIFAARQKQLQANAVFVVCFVIWGTLHFLIGGTLHMVHVPQWIDNSMIALIVIAGLLCITSADGVRRAELGRE